MQYSHAIITGGCGFLGRQLVSALIAKDIQVITLDRNPSGPDGCLHIPGDVTETIGQALSELNSVPQAKRVLFHLAGLSDAAQCARELELTQQMNVDLVEFVMNTALASGIGCALLPSTGYVYGEDGTFTEASPLEPASAYAQSKVAAETVFQQYNDRCKTVVARLSNVYGPDSSPNTVIGRLLAQVSSGDSLSVWSLAPIRDFIHIDDVIDGFIRLCETNGNTPILANLSTGHGTSIGEMVDLIAKKTGLFVDKEGKPGQKASTMVLDNSHIRTLTNWTPKVIMDIGLNDCIARVTVSR
ncbi:NAD(P)-dependent oxidoreductase [Pseudodesulfovibrio sp.]|nr:NAD(P)-dependent oxidoreductase [Pseudodesulfovibrio sp.]